MCATPHLSRRTRTGWRKPGTCSLPESTARAWRALAAGERSSEAGAAVQSKIETIKSGNIFMDAVTKGRDRLSVYAGADAAGLLESAFRSKSAYAKRPTSSKLRRDCAERDRRSGD